MGNPGYFREILGIGEILYMKFGQMSDITWVLTVFYAMVYC